MKGANEYAKLFKTGQYGRLYITSSSHARGRTFRIQILPEGEKAKPNGSHNQCLNKDAVLVYGPVSGNLGWTETYGWLHEGKWQEDFDKLYRSKLLEIEEREKMNKAQSEKSAKKEEDRIRGLLSSY